MIRGLYTAHTGMLNEQNRLDVITNNLANAATTGYKKEGMTNQSFDDVLTVKLNDNSVGALDETIGSMSLGVKAGEVYTDYSQGSLRETGSTYDMALEGNGFFTVAVKDAQGNDTMMYTRDGSFKLNSEGYVVDSEGNHLMSESGYLQIPNTSGSVGIDGQGNVVQDGETIDRLLLVDFEDYNYLNKYGYNLYKAVDGATEREASCTLHQGFTEQSNVNSVYEMVQMISITRAYEANQKVMNTVDTMLDKAVNSVGNVR